MYLSIGIETTERRQRMKRKKIIRELEESIATLQNVMVEMTRHQKICVQTRIDAFNDVLKLLKEGKE